MSTLRMLRPALPILIGASLMLSLGMGLRQSLGLFTQPLIADVGVTLSQFTLAIAVQNLAWGVLQPFAGAATVRWGFRPIMLLGSLLYLCGLLALSLAHGLVGVMLGAGVLIGIALACTAAAISMAVAAQAVPTAARSLVLGIVSAAGSIGALVAAPLGQTLMAEYGWRIGVGGFVLLSVFMLPAAWYAGKIDRLVLPRTEGEKPADATAMAAAATAFRHVPFLVMSAAYFVCGMQLVFLTTHLPSYLSLCGMDPMLGAEALGVIGGFNILGSLFFGWAGGKWNKLALLGSIYVTRSLALAAYFALPPTAEGTLLFAAVMGFLWLGVGPLVAGSVIEMFGLRWQAMIGGIAFVSHQFGSFMGAYGGGRLFDATGSYTTAWQVGVSLGLTAGLVQIMVALIRPPPPPLPA